MATTKIIEQLVGEMVKDFNSSFNGSTIATSDENFGQDATGNDLEISDRPRVSEDQLIIDVAHYLNLILTMGICAALSTFSVFSNILNMIVFVKDGFQVSINISLVALAFADLSSGLTLLWYTICLNPLFKKADLPFLPSEIEPLTSGIPHAIAMNATGWLTAFITLERCLCVVFPLNVKDILSRTRTKVIVAIIFIGVIGGQMPSYYTLRMGWRFVPERNKTLLGLYVIENSEEIDKITFYITNVTAPVLSFMIVIASSIILSIQLTLKSKWRQKSATAKPSDEKSGKQSASSLSPRDWKVVKMITIIAIIFIISFTPYVLISTVMASEPQFRFYGKYRYIFSICVSIGSFLESLNASSNIFIYYTMSTKYKNTIRGIFRLSQDKITD